MIEAEEFRGGPDLHSPRHAGWVVRMGLVLLGWFGMEWVLDGAWREQMDWQPFQQYANKMMWAYEAAEAGGVRLGDWLTGTYTAEDMVDQLSKEYREVMREPNTAWLGAELALVLHRAALEVEDVEVRSRLVEEAKERMRASPGWDEVETVRLGRNLIFGERWESADRERLAGLRKEWPEWWSVHYVCRQGLNEGNDGGELPAAAAAALHDLRLIHGWTQAISVLGLAGLVSWGRLRRGAVVERRSTARLTRLWRPGRMMVVFAVCSVCVKVVALVFAQTGGLSFYWLLGEGMPAWWLGQAVNQLFHAVLVAFPAYALLSACVRRWRWFGRATRLRLREFGLPVLWLKGGCLAALILTVTWGVMPLLEGLFPSSGVADWVSRSMYGWGELALPLALFWGAVVAPLVEEVLFRGLIFRSLCNRFDARMACVISSVIFAASHGYSATGFVSVFLMGAAFCWIYHRSGSLALAMMTHACINGWFALSDFIWLR